MTKQRGKSLFITKGANFSATHQLLLFPENARHDLMEGRTKQGGHLYPVFFSAWE